MGKVLHASYSGYFPYCLNTANVSAFSYVAQINLDLAMAIFWRAKKIRWFGALTWPSAGFINFPWHLEISSSATTEDGLVCWPKWIVSSVENLTDGGGNPIVVGSAAWEITEFYYEDGSNQSNLVNADLGIGAFFLGTGNNLGFFLSSIYINPVFQYYSMPFANAGTLVLAGEFPYTGAQPPTFDSTPPNDYSVTLNHTIEYWSYGGTYDTTTGQPL
jgi:hypothetical protein